VVLTSGLTDAETDKTNFARWRTTEIIPNRLVPWVDKDLRKAWGFKAAARANHIARTGCDEEVAGQ